MGPRTKQIRNELLHCDICGCAFTNRDTAAHSEICSKDNPLMLTLKEKGDCKAVDYHACKHGLIIDDILLGNVEEAKIKDLPDHFPKNLRQRMILINPATMKILRLFIGNPAVIDWKEVCYVWPCPSVPLTSVKMTKETIEELQWQQQNVIVQALACPDIPAHTVYYCIRNKKTLDFKHKDLSDHIVRASVGRYVTAGSRLCLDYFGCVCKLEVTTVIGADESLHYSDSQSSLIDSLSEDVNKLHLETSLPYACSTPEGKVSKRDYIPSLPQFYKISVDTVFITEDQSPKDEDKCEMRPTLKDFGGFSKQIGMIKEAISTHLFMSDLLQKQGLKSPGGLLLYGPSGGGKTMLVHALAKEFNIHFISINGADVWSRYYGESEAKLTSLIREAETREPSIVFLDEIDILCPKRDRTKTDVEKRVVAALISSLDRLTANRNRVFVLAATNKRHDVDSALRRPGRLDKEVEIGVPSVADRQEIIEKLLQKTENEINFDIKCHIAERAHGFLGADLAAVFKEATLHAAKRASSSSDMKLLSEDLLYGFQLVKPSAMKEVTLEVSKVSWSDIGGQEELKHKLRQAVEWPLKHPEAFIRLGIRPPRGLLMYGPPGCSKTMIAKALAKESGLNFIAIKGPELFSKWVGESERAVREVFHRARAAAPAIVFFDEIDALAGERGSGGGAADVSDRVLAQLLTEMDGVQALEDILVVAATNRPDRIDKALMRPGRLDRIIYVPLPDEDTRRDIFCIHFKKTPVASDVDVRELVDRTEGYSGAEVTAVCYEAALAALQEDINTKIVHRRHFDEALHTVKPRITADLLDLYDKFRDQNLEFH